MNIPLNLFTWGLAVLPILVLLILMIGFQWGATKAAPVGLGIAALSALLFYRADLNLVLLEGLKGTWSTLTVLVIVWPAILIFEVVSQAKAFIVFKNGLQKISPNELIQVIAVGWVFVSFLQGVTGFGVPVAVGAPLLIGIGVNPIWAVLIPLIGHAWANTFGTLAIAWDTLVAQTNLTSNPVVMMQAALWAAIFIWVWNIITGIAIAWIYGKKEALVKGWPAILVISLIQGGGQLLLSQVNTTLAAFIPATVALVSVILLSRTKLYNKPWKLENSPVMNRKLAAQNGNEVYPKNMSMHQAFLPYYILTFVTLFVLLIQPIKNTLGAFRLGFAFPQTITGYGFINKAVALYAPLSPLTSAGTFLILASVIGYLFYARNGWVNKGDFKLILKRSIDKTIPSSIAVLAFIVMSRVMGGTGQTIVLAQGIATVLGPSYAIFAPVIGMLGAFITSSNTASNILFGEFQLNTAQLLALDPAPILGAQTAGGAIGNTICPGNIILGTTTAGTLGKEGLILKKVLPLTAAAAVIVGLILFVTQVIL
jgi:lactate permease